MGKQMSRWMKRLLLPATRLTAYDTASPSITIDRKDLERGGYSSLADVFRRLPQNLSSLSAAALEGQQSEFGVSPGPTTSPIGVSSINLRGLGSRSTLILVNGRRRSGSALAAGSFTDISSIPLSQVESINIVTDGASAIYGADAVGGVVDIILRKDYDGGQLQVRHENSATGADRSEIDAAYTIHWDSGFASASLSFTEEKQADSRQFIHVGPNGVGDFTDLGGVNTRTIGTGTPGSVFSVFNHPFRGPLPDAFLGFIPDGQDGGNLQLSDLVDGAPGTSLNDPALRQSIRNARQYFENPAIGPDSERKSLRINGEQELAGDYTFSFDVGYTEQEDVGIWEPELRAFNFFSPSSFGGLTLVPEANPSNNLGQDVLVAYSFENEFPQLRRSANQEQDNLDIALELDGRLPFTDTWHLKVNYAYSQQKGRDDNPAGLSNPRIRSAVFAPFILGSNLFSDGSSQDVIAANARLLAPLIETARWTGETDVHSAEVVARGEVFSLPAGDVEAVIGVNFRREDTLREVAGDTRGVNSQRETKALFAELGVPLLEDLPFVDRLNLTMAVRYEEIDQKGENQLLNTLFSFAPPTFEPMPLDTGDFDITEFLGLPESDELFLPGPNTPAAQSYSSTTPQFGLNWKVSEALRLRATWGESFLTPLPEQFVGTVLVEGPDFLLSQPEVVVDPDTVVIRLLGASPTLEPQDAKTWTVGFDYQSSLLDGLTLGATYSEIKYENFIAPAASNTSLAELFDNRDALPKVF